ncbi:hypothetical protein IEO21_09442 [Rhodonia placenta]|uniref:Uncharacterized protein n=1 Tax=Rhodonia placenta TaxID=104341 RepID=A0A8H7TYG3_9APHY|nr:hypothetical protein IEO21_09442 [Postia placenta]
MNHIAVAGKPSATFTFAWSSIFHARDCAWRNDTRIKAEKATSIRMTAPQSLWPNLASDGALSICVQWGTSGILGSSVPRTYGVLAGVVAAHTTTSAAQGTKFVFVTPVGIKKLPHLKSHVIPAATFFVVFATAMSTGLKMNPVQGARLAAQRWIPMNRSTSQFVTMRDAGRGSYPDALDISTIESVQCNLPVSHHDLPPFHYKSPRTRPYVSRETRTRAAAPTIHLCHPSTNNVDILIVKPTLFCSSTAHTISGKWTSTGSEVLCEAVRLISAARATLVVPGPSPLMKTHIIEPYCRHLISEKNV